MSEIERIADQVQRAFAGPAWSGPAAMELLADVSAPAAAKRPIARAHSIWEIVLHMTFWKRVVTAALQGEELAVTPERDWPPTANLKDSDWEVARRDIEKAHKELLGAMRQFPESRLHEHVPGRDFDFYVVLHGIAQHDLYHAGQIAVLKKS